MLFCKPKWEKKKLIYKKKINKKAQLISLKITYMHSRKIKILLMGGKGRIGFEVLAITLAGFYLPI